ncbi:MAG TPA: L-glutamate gamma-semialdehyde dehydrogenase [Candidatus Xenobia bacterium]|nr:L-glutamate gamma-semialdehyde dehydrogenase [Candidatus Xenobia bacterium]
MKKLPAFKNEPFQDFSKKPVAAKLQAAIQKVRASFGREYPLVIGGREVKSDQKLVSINPSNKSEVVGVFQKATAGQAREAVEVAYQAFQTWRYEPVEKRVERMLRVAKIMRQRKNELVAWCILEAGKTWTEADADVAEAIDFAEWYSREALRICRPQPTYPFPGEKPEQVFIPLGVTAVIPPWNFPAAILSGMTFAALVGGNTVVLKPSSETPGIGWQIAKILMEAGFPDGVINFVPGGGATAGNAMVEHPKTRLIAFTGSMEVGLDIVQRAAVTQPGQIWIKRVIAEMGGKNAQVVDDSADLDAAAEAAKIGAFGFQGQKCSAASRLVVHQKVYDKFLEKLVPRVKAIRVGPSEDPANWMGPVIGQSAYDSIMGYISVGKNEGKLLAGGEGDDSRGFFIQPTVFTDVDPHARIAQEEIFGPVTAVIPAKNFEHAIEVANCTKFGLTGAVFSSSRKHLEYAKERFFCGNLYLNRKCTGAMVGAHPFGGFNMSGTDSKTGGREYLLLFTQAKAITEKLGMAKKR